jgi:hypothetical protein
MFECLSVFAYRRAIRLFMPSFFACQPLEVMGFRGVQEGIERASRKAGGVCPLALAGACRRGRQQSIINRLARLLPDKESTRSSTMMIDRDKAKADGLTGEEIAFVESYLDEHGINNDAALVKVGANLRWVTETVAEALDQLRPGCWLR